MVYGVGRLLVSLILEIRRVYRTVAKDRARADHFHVIFFAFDRRNRPISGLSRIRFTDSFCFLLGPRDGINVRRESTPRVLVILLGAIHIRRVFLFRFTNSRIIFY